ncbi:MAG: ABC transporter permease [Mobilitalea sp.]
MKKMKRRFNTQAVFRFAPMIGLVLIVAFFAIVSKGKSISTANLNILINQVTLTALIAIGGIFAFTVGALDMSMSGSVCCTAIVAAIIGNMTGSTVVMITVCIVMGLLLGLLKAGFSIYMNVPSFMITIVLGMALASLGNVLLGTQSNLSVSDLVGRGQNTTLYIILLFGFYLIAAVIFNFTTFGKGAKIVGGNPRAADQTGISSVKVKLYAFLLGGIGIALTSIVVLMRSKSVNASTASSIGMDMMVAIVLGGMPLAGGAKSKISAALIGAAIITVLNNGLVVIGVDSSVIQLVRGILFLIVVFITGFSYRTNLLPR